MVEPLFLCHKLFTSCQAVDLVLVEHLVSMCSMSSRLSHIRQIYEGVLWTKPKFFMFFTGDTELSRVIKSDQTKSHFQVITGYHKWLPSLSITLCHFSSLFITHIILNFFPSLFISHHSPSLVPNLIP